MSKTTAHKQVKKLPARKSTAVKAKPTPLKKATAPATRSKLGAKGAAKTPAKTTKTVKPVKILRKEAGAHAHPKPSAKHPAAPAKAAAKTPHAPAAKAHPAVKPHAAAKAHHAPAPAPA